MIVLALPCVGMDSSRRWFESHQSFRLFHERGFFLFLIYQEQAIGPSFKKQWCIWRSHLCPLKLICHFKDVFLDICTSRPLPMISDTV
jgi:hypothetical protein